MYQISLPKVKVIRGQGLDRNLPHQGFEKDEPHLHHYHHRLKGEKKGRETTIIDVALIVLKGVAAITGALLAFAGIYSLYPLSSSLTSPPLCCLKVYSSFFGLSILLIEGKAILPDHSILRLWFYSEFHFLTTPRGRGFYYSFVGAIALCQADSHSLFTLIGISMLVLALFNFIASSPHDRKRRATDGMKLPFRETFKTSTNVYAKHGKGKQSNNLGIEQSRFWKEPPREETTLLIPPAPHRGAEERQIHMEGSQKAPGNLVFQPGAMIDPNYPSTSMASYTSPLEEFGNISNL